MASPCPVHTSARLAPALAAAVTVPATFLQRSVEALPHAIVRLAAPLQLSELAPTGAAAAATDEDCGCEPSGVVVPTPKGVLMNDVQVTGATLRSTELATQTGGRATIGSMIGEDGKAVVIFLRHLG